MGYRDCQLCLCVSYASMSYMSYILRHAISHRDVNLTCDQLKSFKCKFNSGTEKYRTRSSLGPRRWTGWPERSVSPDCGIIPLNSPSRTPTPSLNRGPWRSTRFTSCLPIRSEISTELRQSNQCKVPKKTTHTSLCVKLTPHHGSPVQNLCQTERNVT